MTILDQSLHKADIGYDGYDKDQMKAYDTLAAHYVQEANKEKNKDKKRELFTKVGYRITTQEDDGRASLTNAGNIAVHHSRQDYHVRPEPPAGAGLLLPTGGR